MQRPRLVGATILAGLFILILGGLVLGSILEQRNSEKLDAGWEILQRAMVRGQDDSDFAVGFHLGHSRLTAVAWFRNGTTMNLANVDGSPEYKLAMEAAIKGDEILASCEAVFAENIDKLANVSESRLGVSIRDFELAAPWLETYSYPTHGEDVLTRALRLTRAAANRPPGILHVNEAAAVNVANGRQRCREANCVHAGHWGPFRRLCYVSLTNDALYSSTQSDSCLHLSWGARAQVDTEAGLHMLAVQNPNKYWAYLHQRLAATVSGCIRGSCQPTTILASGEAMTNSKVLSILEAVAHSAQNYCDEHPTEPYTNDRGEREPKPTVQLLVSEDPVFAAAKGAAFSMRRHYWNYCAIVNKTEANNIYWNPDYDDGGYWNPVKTIGPKMFEQANDRWVM